MAQSKIEWCGPTWNPLAGCTREDTDCDGCYAAPMALRLEAMALADLAAGRDPGGKRKYIGVAVKTGNGRTAFNGTINLDEQALLLPLSWKKPQRIFVNSMSDLFHKHVPEEFIDRVFAVMALAHWHTFQILTKRPERAVAYFAHPNRAAIIDAQVYALRRVGHEGNYTRDYPPVTLPLPNVQLGTSAGFQEAADRRIPQLLRVPAAIRFLSLEPLIGPVNLDRFFGLEPGNTWSECLCTEISPEDRPCLTCESRLYLGERSGLHWVITGAESGPNARPMDENWVRSLRDQCVAAGVAFFYKQNVQGGKKIPLPMLDGRQWAEFPEVAQ